VIFINAEHDAWLKETAEKARMPKARLVNHLIGHLREKGIQIKESISLEVGA
jgi:hypothetical protein